MSEDEIEATCSPSSKRIEQLETELTAEREKVAKLRAAMEYYSSGGNCGSGIAFDALAETAPKEVAK